MQKLFSLILCLCICTFLSSCVSSYSSSTTVNEYEDGYNYGYDSGYEQGVYDGIEEARDYIAIEAWSLYQDMEGQTTKERGLHPEEAIIVLNDYLDGEYVSDDELETAIKSITYFYYHAWDVIDDIEDIDVYFDFD